MSVRTRQGHAARSLLESLEPGASIYVQGSAGESFTFCDLIALGTGLREPVFFSSLIPGLNSFDYTAHLPGARLITLLLPPALRGANRAGRVSVLPVTYSRAAAQLAQGKAFDLAIAHAAPPDADGICSLGTAADFLPLVWSRAKRRLLIINPDMPWIPGAAAVHSCEASALLEGEGAPPVLAVPAADSAAVRIASLVAGLIRDGDTLQVGIGSVPDSVMAELHGRRDLVIHSGAVGDGLIGLAEAGALRAGRVHRVGALVGSAELRRFAAANDILNLVDTQQTHAAHLFPAIPRFISVNSALEVDLFGQVNLEWRGTQQQSGVGGAPDFIQGARLSPGGRSVIALRATADRGTVSRIVPRLECPTVSVARHETDTIVTEYGAADIGGLTAHGRADALIAIAAPEFRAGLEHAWAKLS
jgi:acyl-CoA hydrolase